jgi:hypothetical protein
MEKSTSPSDFGEMLNEHPSEVDHDHSNERGILNLPCYPVLQQDRKRKRVAYTLEEKLVSREKVACQKCFRSRQKVCVVLIAFSKVVTDILR